MIPSLLDTADVGALRSLCASGAGGLAVALIDGRAVRLEDAGGADRMIAVAATAVGLRERIEAAAAAAGQEAPASSARDPHSVLLLVAVGAGEALALALGAAVAAATPVPASAVPVVAATAEAALPRRVWCVLDGAECDDGSVWEVAQAAAAVGAGGLTVAVEGAGSAGMWRACGWRVVVAPADDPLRLLGALDQAMAEGHQPAAVLAEPR